MRRRLAQALGAALMLCDESGVEWSEDLTGRDLHALGIQLLKQVPRDAIVRAVALVLETPTEALESGLAELFTAPASSTRLRGENGLFAVELSGTTIRAGDLVEKDGTQGRILEVWPEGLHVRVGNQTDLWDPLVVRRSY